MTLINKNLEKINLCIVLLTLLAFLTHNYFRGLTFLWGILGVFYIKKYGYKKMGFEKPLILYVTALFLSLIFALDQKYSFNEIYRHIFGFLAPFFISQIAINKRTKERAINLIMLLLTIYFFIDLRILIYKKMFSYYFSRFSPLGIMPVEFCFIVGVILLYIFSCYLKEQNKILKIVNLIGIFLMLYVLLQTKTRGAWIGLGISMTLIYLINSKRLKENLIVIFLASFIGSSCLYIFRNTRRISPIYNRIVSIINITTDRSNSDRIIAWKIGVARFSERKITGWGYKVKQAYNTTEFGGLQKLDHPHNEYISYLVGTGIVGLFSYLYLMVMIALKSFQNRDDICWLTMFGITAYTLTYGVVENLFHVTNSLFLFLFFLSICLIKENKNED